MTMIRALTASRAVAFRALAANNAATSGRAACCALQSPLTTRLFASKTVSPEEIATTFPQIMQAGTQFFSGQALYAIIRLGIPNLLGNETLTIDDLMKRLPSEHKTKVQEETLLRVMRFVAATTPFLELSATDNNELAFSLTRAGALLQTNVPNQPYLGCVVEHFHEPGMWSAWGKLPDYVLGNIDPSEGPFQAANDMPIFEWYAKHHETAGRPMNEVMDALSEGQLDAIVKSFDWDHLVGKKIVDVGGSHGHAAGAIKAAFPDIHCISMDLPEVINSLPEKTKAKNVEYVAGDMFNPSTFPSNCDVLFMKRILHDWSDEDCINILKSCHQVLGDDGTVVVCDALVPTAKEAVDSPDKGSGVFMADMIMMLIKGKERTKEQWATLADAGGFVISDITFLLPPTPPIITLKKK